MSCISHRLCLSNALSCSLPSYDVMGSAQPRSPSAVKGRGLFCMGWGNYSVRWGGIADSVTHVMYRLQNIQDRTLYPPPHGQVNVTLLNLFDCLYEPFSCGPLVYECMMGSKLPIPPLSHVVARMLPCRGIRSPVLSQTRVGSRAS